MNILEICRKNNAKIITTPFKTRYEKNFFEYYLFPTNIVIHLGMQIRLQGTIKLLMLFTLCTSEDNRTLKRLKSKLKVYIFSLWNYKYKENSKKRNAKTEF